ncbi:MAG: hypothetical protein IKZ87_07935 [Actinomycetaceae bacterium]|nr:hypothetical protein [Actinomycetaceae bacterium]
MLFKKFLTIIQGVHMPVVPSDATDSPFGAAHAHARAALVRAPSVTVPKFEISDALAGHTFRRRFVVPVVQR